MIDYSVFDSLFDSIVVVDVHRKILYCNEAAAALAGSSVRRLTKGVIFADVYSLDDQELYPVSGGELGRESAAPMRELNFTIKSSGRAGKLQTTVQPYLEGAEKRWIVIMHDVTLEETLHTKYQGELEQVQQAKAKLEDYSKNLEHMVEERTAEVRTANRMLNAIMNSLGQGFLVFDRKGICSTVFTKACSEILQCVPAHMPIWDVLRLKDGDLNQFKMWMQAAFNESLPFESMVDLAPSLYDHSDGKHVTLSYYPIRSDEGSSITHLVMVATDRTREYEAEQALLKEQAYIQMVLKVIKSRDQFGLFLSGTKTLIQTMKADIVRRADKFDFAEAFRILHTLEGEAGLFSASSLRQVSRDCQQVLEPFREGADYSHQDLLNSLNQEVLKLEVVFGEFLKTNSELLEVLKIGETRNVEVSVPQLLDFADFMAKNASPLVVRERFAEEMLKQPLTTFVRHFNEVAQHVATSEGKILRVDFDCDRVRVAPGVFDGLFASLVHAFRNAVDHGIETPAVRQDSGKSEVGHIKVSASEFNVQSTRWVQMVIEDDGAGINPEIIRKKLGEKFTDKDFSKMSDQEVIQGVFMPSFSSREAIGQFSGRGIGMDAIKTEVERLGGRVSVQSTQGQGTRLTLEFPAHSTTESFAKSA